MMSAEGFALPSDAFTPRPRVLVVAPPELRAQLGRSLPDCELLTAANPLEGLWKGGREPFDGVFVALNSGRGALRAVAGLRRVAPGLRIVVGCEVADEPLARQALAAGADDYVLQPLRRADLEQAFRFERWADNGSPAASGTRPPSLAAQFQAVLEGLADGPQATAERLAALLRVSFEAAGARVELEDLSADVGEANDPVLEEAILHGGQRIGRVALGRRRTGAYPADAAQRLAEYARLVSAAVEQARQCQRWRELAWTDDLSGLRNRRYFEQALDQLTRRAAEKRLRLTVLLFDIDDFKSYNDRFGHETGDRLIQEVAVLLKHCTRRRDVVVRYGGDEFAVVFWDAEKQRVPGSEHPREPIELATRFCRAMAEHDFRCLGAQAPGPVTISGGLACFPWNGTTRAELIAAADQALLTAKHTGKNRIHLAGQPLGGTAGAD